jgi:hypothetical protein
MMWRSPMIWGYQGTEMMTIYQLKKIEKFWKSHAIPEPMSFNP